MPYSDQSYNLRIELDTKNCELSADQIRTFERDLDSLSRLTEDFPLSDLYITVIRHPRSHDYHVKTALALSGKRLFTGDRDVEPHPAYQRCIRKLVHKVGAYKERMSKADEVSKERAGTRYEIEPTQIPDVEAMHQAVEGNDLPAFRRACDAAYGGPLRMRIGRVVQRYPTLEAELGVHLQIADIFDEVILNAFEGFTQKSAAVPMEAWLEELIEPSIWALLRNPEEEFDNISFERTWVEQSESQGS